MAEKFNILGEAEWGKARLSPCVGPSPRMCMSGGGQSGWISGAFLHSARLCFIHRLRPDPAQLLF